jgi:putative radical SAM enzyme (TIGR03279 family)
MRSETENGVLCTAGCHAIILAEGRRVKTPGRDDQWKRGRGPVSPGRVDKQPCAVYNAGMKTTNPAPPAGGLISAIWPDGIAEALSWQPGDRLLSLNGRTLHDVIDYRFYETDSEVEAEVDHGSHVRTYTITKQEDEDLGVDFADGLFDPLHTCRNDCSFCFLKGLPTGLRSTLYLRDDDYRYSFLFGNFITLTNLREEDWERIAEQQLSPLYVSVHATDLATRRRLLGNPRAGDIMQLLQRLAGLGIQFHTQIVLAPPHNTGEILERTVHDLATLHPALQSIGIVPVGLTHVNADLRAVAVDEMQVIVQRHRAWRRQFTAELGSGLVYLADELFLRTGASVPAARYYEGFPQEENGIGLVRRLLDDWSRLRRRGPWRSMQPPRMQPLRMTLACGTLVEPSLRNLAVQWNAVAPARMEVIAIPNRLFGPSVTVSGLLAGKDVCAGLQGSELGDVVVLPRAMFDAGGALTLDDVTLPQIQEQLGRPVYVAGCLSDVATIACSPRVTDVDRTARV